MKKMLHLCLLFLFQQFDQSLHRLVNLDLGFYIFIFYSMCRKTSQVSAILCMFQIQVLSKADHPVAFVISFCISCVNHWVRDVKRSLEEMGKDEHLDITRFWLNILLLFSCVNIFMDLFSFG